MSAVGAGGVGTRDGQVLTTSGLKMTSFTATRLQRLVALRTSGPLANRQGRQIAKCTGLREVSKHLGTQAMQASIEGEFDLGKSGAGMAAPPSGHFGIHLLTQRPPLSR
jgi:hypothetical protein